MAVAFAAANDTLFVATSRGFLLRHDVSGVTNAGEQLRGLARFLCPCLGADVHEAPCRFRACTSARPPHLSPAMQQFTLSLPPPHPWAPTVAELEVSKAADARIRRLFVDPLGLHHLLVLQSGSATEVHHVDSSFKKSKSIGKLRGVGVTSVAWGPRVAARTLRCGAWGDVLATHCGISSSGLKSL